MKIGTVIFRVVIVIWLIIISLGLKQLLITQETIKNFQYDSFQLIALNIKQSTMNAAEIWDQPSLEMSDDPFVKHIEQATCWDDLLK